MENQEKRHSFNKTGSFKKFKNRDGQKTFAKNSFGNRSTSRRSNDDTGHRVFSKDGVREERNERYEDRRSNFKRDRFDRHQRFNRDERYQDREHFDKYKKIDLDIDYLNLDDGQRRIGFSPFQIRLVQSILTECLTEGKSLDKAYAIYFAKVKLEPIEQGFIIKQINSMFSHLSYYAYIAGLKRPSDFARHVNRLIVTYCIVKKFSVPNLDCEGFDRSGVDKRIKEANDDVLLSQGCPIWLEEQASKELGEAWAKEREVLALEAHRYIRANTLKTTREHLGMLLSKEGVVTKPVKGAPIALEITSNSALFRTKAFKDGLFEQQDAGSQLIAPFLDIKPGQRVVDTCAGAGGKTLHLAAIMEGKGSILALDTEQWKLDALKKRARRAGAFNIEPRHISSSKIIKRLYDHADRVLIDAPCSGTGVLRRTVDSKWRDSRASLNELKEIQADILNRYSKIVKVGGLVVYSTCSILPSENREQIDKFLENHKDCYELIEDKVVLPSSGFDGFYMAKLKRIA